MADIYNNLYLDARRELRKAGVEQAQLEARELLCFAADKTREQFLRDLQLYASDTVCERFRELLARRLAGKYIAPETEHLKNRVGEINRGEYDQLIEAIMQKPITEMQELYNTRDIEK